MAYTPLYGFLFFAISMTMWLYIFHRRVWMPEMWRHERHFIKQDWRKLLSWHRDRLNQGALAELQRCHEWGELRSQVRRRFEFCFLEGLFSWFPLHFGVFVVAIVVSLSIASIGMTP
jgi:hypothetical protein